MKGLCERSSRCLAAAAREMRYSAEGTRTKTAKTWWEKVLSPGNAEIDRFAHGAHEPQHATGATRRSVLDLESRCGVGRATGLLDFALSLIFRQASASRQYQFATGGAPVPMNYRQDVLLRSCAYHGVDI